MIRLDAGDYLVRQGDAPTCAYVIESGSLDVLAQGPEGERLLAVLGEGEIVGEMALVDQAPRTASVRARETCRLLPVTADSLGKRLEAADPVLRLVLGTVLDRYRRLLGGGGAPARSIPPALRAAVNAELRLEEEFAQALADGQIQVHYQPIVDLNDHRLAGFEALARWMHPTRGLIPPAAFVPIAESSGLTGALTRACLGRVVRDLPLMRARRDRRRPEGGRAAGGCEGNDFRISVNISGHDLMVEGFVVGLADLARDAGASPAAITLELTETVLVRNPSEAASALAQARALGFRIAVDDFGTGYSTLNYIRTLPIDMLKIDKTFVQGMSECATTRSIVASTLMLAASLEIGVVGEGIELADQHALLQMLGCDYGQGFLYGRPMPLGQALQLIDGWSAPAAPVTAISVPSA